MGPELPQGSLQEGNQGVPGGPLVRTQHLHCSGPGSVALVRGLKVILQAVGAWPEKQRRPECSWV